MHKQKVPPSLKISKQLLLAEEPFLWLFSRCSCTVYTYSVVNSVSCDTGATLSKGLNRGLGTLTAAGLALAVAELSTHMGKFDVVFLIISTFIVGEY